MITKHIVVEPFDEHWRLDFLKIQNELTDALGQLAISIEHVGSTSVQGLSAKPIIDIDVVIKDYNALKDTISALEKIGYQYEGDLGIPGREAFRYDGKDHLKKHHLYVCPADSPELKRHIAFRNYLRTHPETNCQGLFNQIHKKATKKCQKQILAPDTFADGLFAPA